MHCIVMGLGYSISFPLAFVSVLFPFSLLLLFIAILASVCFFFSSLHFDFLATLHVLDFFFFWFCIVPVVVVWRWYLGLGSYVN